MSAGTRRPMPPVASAGDAGASCDNCGAVLVGPYCHQCGQPDVDHLSSVREFFAHLAAQLAGYDSRLIRTMRALFVRPGLLTAEYIAGRRVRYLPPLQVYLIGATLLFLAASYNPMVVFNPGTRTFRSALPTMNFQDRLDDADVARLTAHGVSLELFGERFSNATTGHLSTFLVLIVPIFALLVAVTFLLARRPFAHHFLFALHWTGWYLLVLAVLQLPPRGWLHAIPLVTLVLVGAPFLYLLVAARRAYGTSWLAALFRAAILYTGFLALMVVWLQVVTSYTVAHVG
jgi:hypothetical protein